MHGWDHALKEGMIMQMRELWFTKGFTIYTENFCKRCVICTAYNIARGIKTPLASQPAPDGPFEYLMIDFIELTPCGKTEILFGSRGYVVTMEHTVPNTLPAGALLSVKTRR